MKDMSWAGQHEDLIGRGRQFLWNENHGLRASEDKLVNSGSQITIRSTPSRGRMVAVLLLFVGVSETIA